MGPQNSITILQTTALEKINATQRITNINYETSGHGHRLHSRRFRAERKNCKGVELLINNGG
jgi:hypothetical protein